MIRVINFYPDTYVIENNRREISIISHGGCGYVMIDKKILNPFRFYQYIPRWKALDQISRLRLIACYSATNIPVRSYWNKGEQSFGAALSSIMHGVTCECYSGTVMSECDPELLWPVYQSLGHQKTQEILRQIFTDGVIKNTQNNYQPVTYLNGVRTNYYP